MNCLRAGRFNLPLCSKTYVMGILNVTPDSFSDAGKYFDANKAAVYALEMCGQGADIIDIGAQSTRPDAEPVSAQTEIERLSPVLEALKGRLNVPVSVDTFYPQTAEYALSNGASIINDVSGRVDGRMASIVNSHNAGWVIMHNCGGAGAHPEYPQGVANAVRSFFEASLRRAGELAVESERICLDVGIGFGKSHEDNLTLIKELRKIKIDGIALLVGASRKRLIGIAANEPDPTARAAGTVAAHTLAIAGGADIIRVHDVRQAVQAARTAEAILYG
ncbi:MAG: dihydropteroate synthase [Clostridiales bacterium]|jgi:dihydropteroate synthase|nr:dihydropteroate synthase [Clostridiales bacterium]